MASSLFARLSLVFALILLALGLMTLAIANRSQQRYFEEFTQELNRPAAMYMANQTRLFVDGQPDVQALGELASHVMMINPSLQVYLLDHQGMVVGAMNGATEARQQVVDLEPIRQFLSEEPRLPVYGDNPAVPGQRRVFSVFPVDGSQAGNTGCDQCGYVYAVLGGERHSSLWESLGASYAVRDTSVMLAGVLLFALGAGMALFFLMTRPLRAMTAAVGQWRLAAGQPVDANAVGSADLRQEGNELRALESTCRAMVESLNEQYQALDAADKRRRHFLTSVSHDLRTPLTSLSGAIETLLLKKDTLGDQDLEHYLLLAQRQGGRLWRLIAQVFELARLDSGEVTLQAERFPLSELVSDTVQDLDAMAEERGVVLLVNCQCDEKSMFVEADMGLMQRVLENLLTNAIRHTPEGGRVTITLEVPCDTRLKVAVEDTGRGFACALEGCSLTGIDELTRSGTESSLARATSVDRRHLEHGGSIALHGSGLGLGIVQRILAMHGSEAFVWSWPGKGSRICFELPVCQSAPS